MVADTEFHLQEPSFLLKIFRDSWNFLFLDGERQVSEVFPSPDYLSDYAE